MSAFNAYTIRTAQIINLVLAEESGVVPMHLMPYQASVDAHTHYNLQQAVQRNPTLSPSAVASVMGEALRPDMSTNVIAPIANGWGTRRFRFAMKVLIENAMGSRFIYLVTGYTDYSDMSHSGSLDPNMTFNFNNFQRIAEQSMMARNIPVGLNEVQGGSDILKNSLDSTAVPGLMLQRPSDVYLIADDATMVNRSGGMLGLGENTICPLNGTAQLSNAYQACPVRWMSDYLMTVTTPIAGISSEPAIEISERAARLQTSSLAKDDFFRMLTQMLSDAGAPSAARLTMGQLMQIDSTVLQRTSVVPYMPDTQMGSFVTGDNRPLAQIAAMYAQSVPAYMSMCGLSSVEFIQMARSNDLDARPGHVVVTGGNAFTGERPIQALVVAFQNALQHELYPAASYGGQYPFSVKVSAASFGYLHITITDFQGVTEQYSFPCFANNTFNPMVTANQQGYLNLATDMKSLVNTALMCMPDQHAYQAYDAYN